MPKLNLQEATRNMADAAAGECAGCGTPWNVEELGANCDRCDEYFHDMDMSYYDDLARDEEYFQELEAEHEREAQWDDLPDDEDMFDDVSWDWDDPWAAMDYNHERAAA